VGTCGRLELRPGIVTAVAGGAELSVDLRHSDPAALTSMLTAVGEAAGEAAVRRGCAFSAVPVWSIEPIPLDPELVAVAERCCAEQEGRPEAIPSGALHDAAEIARHLPTAMIFAKSKRGLSHAAEEDTDHEDLLASIAAYGHLAAAAL